MSEQIYPDTDTTMFIRIKREPVQAQVSIDNGTSFVDATVVPGPGLRFKVCGTAISNVTDKLKITKGEHRIFTKCTDPNGTIVELCDGTVTGAVYPG